MAYTKKRIPTVSLEKGILYHFLTSKLALQGKLQSSDERWFTSDSRLDIYKCIRKGFESSRVNLTRSQLEFQLNSMFGDDKDRVKKDLIEYDDILSQKINDEPQTLIQSLNEALRNQEVEELIMSAYSCLEKGDTDEALSRLKQGSLNLRKVDDDDQPVSLWDDTEDWVEEVNNRKDFPEKYAGIPTGFPKFDNMTGGLFPAELTVIFGLSGKGKSTLMKQIGVNVRRAGYNILHCGNEEDKFQMRTKYISCETGIKYSHWKRGIWTEQEMRIFNEYKRQQNEVGPNGNLPGKLFVYNFPQQTDATMIERKLSEYTEKGVKIDLVIVDYLDLMSSIKRAYNENDEGGRVTGDLKQIAINFHVPVLVCTQANTTAERQELRERPFLTASDVFGTKRKVHSANTLVGIVNQTATVGAGERDEEVRTHRLVICVPKNRDGGVFTFRLINKVETGQIVEDDGTDQAGIEQELAAQAVLEESQRLERESEGKDQQTIQRQLNASLESEVMNIMESIPTSEESSTTIQNDTNDSSDDEPGLIESLPEGEFFAGISNNDVDSNYDGDNNEDTVSDSYKSDDILSYSSNEESDDDGEKEIIDESNDEEQKPNEERNVSSFMKSILLKRKKNG